MYFRHVVRGGEYVIQYGRFWQITFNGVQIGGLYRAAVDAIGAIGGRRSASVPGPDLTGIADPPIDLALWSGDNTTAL